MLKKTRLVSLVVTDPIHASSNPLQHSSLCKPLPTCLFMLPTILVISKYQKLNLFFKVFAHNSNCLGSVSSFRYLLNYFDSQFLETDRQTTKTPWLTWRLSKIDTQRWDPERGVELVCPVNPSLGVWRGGQAVSSAAPHLRLNKYIHSSHVLPLLKDPGTVYTALNTTSYCIVHCTVYCIVHCSAYCTAHFYWPCQGEFPTVPTTEVQLL